MPGRRQRRVTLEMVAADARVSVATASRVLSGSDAVSDKLRERVETSAAALGFRINRAARSLRRQRAEVIGLVVSDVENPFFATVARAVEAVAQSRGYAVLLCNTDEDLAKEDLYFSLLVEERVAGVIVAPSLEDASRLEPFASDSLPIVCLDREIAGGLIDAVLVDNVAGAHAAIEHLVGDGHRRIGVVAGTVEATPSRQRVNGCREAAAAHDDVLLEVRSGQLSDAVGIDETLRLGGQLAAALLELDRPPSAILCCNNLLTQGVLLHLRQHGRRVPEDVAVIGWDDSPIYELLDPPLTVVSQPSAEIGRTAAELLFDRMAQPARPPVRRLVDPRLVVRMSCGTAHLELATAGAKGGG
jgi:LacI family transcriptional regulator